MPAFLLLTLMAGYSFSGLAQPARFHTLTPCRVLDTRNPTGTYGAPSLTSGPARVFPIFNVCGVPALATAVSGNVTVVNPNGSGDLQIYPGVTSPTATAASFRPGINRANNLLIALASDGTLSFRIPQMNVTADVIFDINGYFFPSELATNYFAMSYPATWMTTGAKLEGTNELDPGAFQVIYQTSGCNNKTMFLHLKGAPFGAEIRPWSSESFYVDNTNSPPCIKAEMEAMYDPFSQSQFYQSPPPGDWPTSYRTLRDRATRAKGVQWLPLFLPFAGVVWAEDPYDEEYWSIPSGSYCNLTRNTARQGSMSTMVVVFTVLADYLYDLRPDHNPAVLHDASCIKSSHTWGPNLHHDVHYHCKWLDPDLNTYRSLGLVKYELWDLDANGLPTTRTENTELRYLAAGPVPVVPCTTCPP